MLQLIKTIGAEIKITKVLLEVGCGKKEADKVNKTLESLFKRIQYF
jgi:hypothetical protein